MKYISRVHNIFQVYLSIQQTTMISVTLNWLIFGEVPYKVVFSVEIDSRKNVSQKSRKILIKA
jgi:hypothetical protein